MASFKFELRREWWDHVRDAPDLIKMMVLRSGTFIGLKGSIVIGGHMDPSSMEGLILEWKNDQKKLKKNIISERIKRIIPILIPFITGLRWKPSFSDSWIVFFHHEKDVIKRVILIKRKVNFLRLKLNDIRRQFISDQV